MIRFAILCLVCVVAISTGLVTGALIAQNQPLSALEQGGRWSF
jgi:hypothetical protein